MRSVPVVSATPSSASPTLRQRMITEMRVRGFSPRTEESYVHAVRALAAFYMRPPDALSRDEVVRFFEALITGAGLSRSTVNVYVCACRFLYQDVLKRDPLGFRLPWRGKTRQRPQILSPEECMRILDAASNPKHRALLYMIYGSGLRVSEATHLQAVHIESDRMMVFIKSGKGHKDRYTLLAAAALEELRAYWRIARPGIWLFPGQDPNQPMTAGCALQIYNRAVKASGVRRVGGIHTLRHCFATHHIENGMDLCSLQRLLGHTSLLTTIRYMHLREDRANRNTHPMDRPAAT